MLKFIQLIIYQFDIQFAIVITHEESINILTVVFVENRKAENVLIPQVKINFFAV